jgi:hypothetical protein
MSSFMVAWVLWEGIVIVEVKKQEGTHPRKISAVRVIANVDAISKFPTQEAGIIRTDTQKTNIQYSVRHISPVIIHSAPQLKSLCHI